MTNTDLLYMVTDNGIDTIITINLGLADKSLRESVPISSASASRSMNSNLIMIVPLPVTSLGSLLVLELTTVERVYP